MNTPDYSALIIAARDGNASAMEALYNTTVQSVYYTASKLIGNPHDAEELTQDTYIKVFSSLDTLQDPAAFPAWANRIAANTCRNYLRKNRPELFFTDEQEEKVLGSIPAVGEYFLPAEFAQNRDKREKLMAAIRELPEKQRVAIFMHYFEDLSIKEMSDALAVGENTVKSRLNAGRASIRTKLEKMGITSVAGVGLAAALQMDASATLVPAAVKKALWAGIRTVGTGAATTAATTAATAAVTSAAVKGGILTSLGAKIITGVLVGALLIGGGAVTLTSIFGSTDDPAENTTIGDISNDDPDEPLPDDKDDKDSNDEGLCTDELPETDNAALEILSEIPYYGDISKCTMTADQAIAYAQIIANGLSGKYTTWDPAFENGISVFWDESFRAYCYDSAGYLTDRAYVILGDFAGDGNPYLYVFSSLVDSSYDVFGWQTDKAEWVCGAESYDGREYSMLFSDYETGKVFVDTSGSMGAASHGGVQYALVDGTIKEVYSWEHTMDMDDIWHVITNGEEVLYTQAEYEAFLQDRDDTIPEWTFPYAELPEVTNHPFTLRGMLSALNSYAAVISNGEAKEVTFHREETGSEEPVAPVEEETPKTSAASRMGQAMLAQLESYSEIFDAVVLNMRGDRTPELVVVYSSENAAACDILSWTGESFTKETYLSYNNYFAIVQNTISGEFGLLSNFNTVDTYYFPSGTITFNTGGDVGAWMVSPEGEKGLSDEEYLAIMETYSMVVVLCSSPWETDSHVEATIAELCAM